MRAVAGSDHSRPAPRESTTGVRGTSRKSAEAYSARLMYPAPKAQAEAMGINDRVAAA